MGGGRREEGGGRKEEGGGRKEEGGGRKEEGGGRKEEEGRRMEEGGWCRRMVEGGDVGAMVIIMVRCDGVVYLESIPTKFLT